MADDIRKFESIEEMIDTLAEGSELREEYDERTRARQLISFLISMRAAKRVTQDDIATAMDVSQSYVSKLESSDDADIKIGEVERYLGALGCDFAAHISPKNQTCLDNIKYHAYQIHSYLGELADLSDPHDGSAQQTANTLVEVLINLVRLVKDASQQLPVHPVTQRPFCKVEMLVQRDKDSNHLCGNSP